jgi:spore coat polysaccharide biosynthesis protein SpsF (cytidylyltransferase family)
VTDRARGRVACVMQARMTSSRLPGKVLEDIAGRPAIQLQLERLAQARELDEIAVATSVESSDDPVVELTERLGVRVFRGPLADVLERYRLAGAALEADAIVRVTGDCPLIDPAGVDEVVARWRATRADYVANVYAPRTYPTGMDTEVVSWPALHAAAMETDDAYDREHVTPYVRDRPDRFAAERVERDPSLGHLRLTLDTPEDLELLRAVAARVDPLRAGLAELAAAVRDEG